jgi:hypothetical protein
LTGENDRPHPQIQIIQHLPQLAQPGIRQFAWGDFSTSVDLHAVGPDAPGGVQCLFERLRQTPGLDGDFGPNHECGAVVGRFPD